MVYFRDASEALKAINNIKFYGKLPIVCNGTNCVEALLFEEQNEELASEIFQAFDLKAEEIVSAEKVLKP